MLAYFWFEYTSFVLKSFVSLSYKWCSRRYEEPIFCLMMTGKDDSRKDFARNALENFHNQTYTSKFMIIVNHGAFNVVERSRSNVLEIHVPKEITLGEMRNTSLSLIPIGTVFAVFDDDDYRSHDYLSNLKEEMDSCKAWLVCLSNRMEYNLNNNFVWKTFLRQGLPSTIMARRIKEVSYKKVRTMEDVSFIADYKSYGKHTVVMKNDPKQYIRTIHRDNTSLFANKYKCKVYPRTEQNPDFQEDNVSTQDEGWVRNKFR